MKALGGKSTPSMIDLRAFVKVNNILQLRIVLAGPLMISLNLRRVRLSEWHQLHQTSTRLWISLVVTSSMSIKGLTHLLSLSKGVKAFSGE